MKKILQFFISIIFTLFLISCGCSKNTEQNSSGKNEIEKKMNKIKVEEINSWLNLMPGAESKFFISGSLKIETSDSVNLNSLSIFQNEKSIYKIVPEFEVEIQNENVLLKFFNNGGEKPAQNIDYEKPVIVQFNLNFGNENIEFSADSIFVERVY